MNIVVTACVCGILGGLLIALMVAAFFSERRRAAAPTNHKVEPAISCMYDDKQYVVAIRRPPRIIHQPSGAPPPEQELELPEATDTTEVGILHMQLLRNQLSKSAHMFSPTSKGSPGKSPKALPVNDGAAATGEAGTRSVSDSSGTVIQPGSPFSRHAAEAKADAVIDVSATPRCWTPGQMVADGGSHKLEQVVLRKFYRLCQDEKNGIAWFWGGYGAVIMRVAEGTYAVAPGPATVSPAVQLVMNELPAAEVVVIATPELTNAALEKLDSDKDYTHLLLSNNTRLQILNSVQQMPRIKLLQNAAILRKERALLVWGRSLEEVTDKLTKLEQQIADTMTSARLSVAAPAQTADSGPTRGVNYATPVSTYLALSGCLAIVMMEVRAIILDSIADDGWWRLAFLVVTCIWVLWLLFLMNCVVGNLRLMLGPVAQAQGNSRFYSAKPPERLTGSHLPHVVIQMPVFMEPLATVIMPTIESLEAAIRTYEWQGGSATIIVCDDGLQILPQELADQRKAFYTEHRLAWVARPKSGDNGYIRRGRFKKASNMNGVLALAADVDRIMEQDGVKHRTALEQVLAEQPHMWAGGDIYMGDYILLVDADTRVPSDCLLDGVSEMQQDGDVAIMQYTTEPFLVVGDYWEKGIAYFTHSIYMAIGGVVSGGEVAPFVGHNAMLRWSAMQEVSFVEDDTRKYWAEDTVSEDFDMSLRLQIAGYYNRYIGYTGEGFMEGVSLTHYDELMRWQKYAWGCSELVFNPLSKWFTRGPLTKLCRKFLFSRATPFHSKVNILGYISTYYAIASSWPMTIVNYIITGYGFEMGNRSYYTPSISIIYSCWIVFSTLGPLSYVSYQYRLKKRPFWGAMWDAIAWTPYMFMFFSGLSYPLSLPVVAHLIGYQMSWGSTPKELDDSNFWREVGKTLWRLKGSYLLFTPLAIGLVLMATIVPAPYGITNLWAIIPLALVVGGHLLAPIVLNPFLMRFKF
ncbi:hypothetical protein ABBQ32_007743 [Trebouxia sp. C0010 RCD-2024]